MQIDIPDPAETGSLHARANFRFALRIAIGFVTLLWVIQLVNWGLDLELERFGVSPRRLDGLPGILFAPLLHASFAHLIANSLPMVVLGTGMLYLYPASAFRVVPAVYLGPGMAVWLFGRDSTHLGASGLIYGLVSYVFVAGVIRGDRRAIAAALLVSFMYGALVWGVLPLEAGVSWETHLAAALIGVALAIALRHLDLPARKRYSWEDEPDGPDNEQHTDESRVFVQSITPSIEEGDHIMQESSNLTIHSCAYTPCNCHVAPGEKYCSDYCEDHARHRIAAAGISSGAEGCGCGHSECGSADAPV